MPQKESAADALTKLAADDNDNNCVEIGCDGGVALFVDLVRTGSDALKTIAAGALGNLARVDALRAEIGREGGIAPLLAILQDGSDQQKRFAEEALGQLNVKPGDECCIIS